MDYKKITFNCEVITPMFMYGADRQTPELRPSEFKGIMRFWWRAIKAEDDIKKLWEEEAKIFGAADEKIGKSKVKVVIYPLEYKIGRFRPLPHHSGDRYCKFLPSCKSKVDPHKCAKGFLTPCILPSSKFRISLTTYTEKIEEIKTTFLLSTILGGFGKRARRGFGSIKVNKIDYSLEMLLELLNKINPLYEIDNIFINGKKIKAIVNKQGGGGYPWIKTILLGCSTSKWEDLLKKIGETTHTYKDPALGFSGKNERLASPIYVTVIDTSKGFSLLITLLNTASNFKLNCRQQEKFIGALL